MKLKDIIKHFDSCSDIDIYLDKDIDEELIFKGSTMNVQAAALPEEKVIKYMAECAELEDIKSIAEVSKARKIIDYELSSGDWWEAISANVKENEHGVHVLTFVIIVKEKE